MSESAVAAGVTGPETGIDFRRLAELAADPIVVHDARGILVWANAAAAALVRAPDAAALVGRQMLDFVAPELHEAVLARVRELAERGGSQPILEEVFVRLDGTRVEVETSGAMLGDGRTLIVVRDISERVRSEREKRAAVSRLRSFFELSSEAIGLGRGGVHVMVNPAHARLFGYDRPEQLIGVPVRDLVAPEDRERFAAGWRQGVPRGRVDSAIVKGLRRDGSRFDMEVRVSFFDEEGERIAIAIIRDVTEERRADEERAALRERLRQSEKLEAVGRLAGGIAHDFNNILSGILGYAELTLLGLDRGTDLHDHQERIREAALRARDLVRQILAFSRRDRASLRVVDVPTVVGEALALMRAGVPASVTLAVHVDPLAGTTAADPTQLHQIVLNLCANARDAVGAYGRIEVRVDPVDVGAGAGDLAAGRYVRLRVKDDGAGMDDATKARLFEPYMTTKGRLGGHGLGLAVVHGIVTAGGGAIRVESAPGRGSTFDVYLPRSDAPATAEPGPTRHRAGRGERILVVDDEPMVRDAHRRLLESLGYQVEVATDGEAALARYRESPGAFDLVLTDQTMPRLSGLDLARAILAIRPDARVVISTGYSDHVDDAEARRVGLRALLPKPIDRATMAAAIQKALLEP